MLLHLYSYLFSIIAVFQLLTQSKSIKPLSQDIETVTKHTQTTQVEDFINSFESTPPDPPEEVDHVIYAVVNDSNETITVSMGPGAVDIPILLYHHVLPDPASKSYTLDVSTFEEQMQILSSLGYESITTLQLQKAIIQGAELPEKPILLTFDDGNIDNYTFAYPIMKSYGFSGTIYIVANRLNAEGFVNVTNLQEMITAGWEIGSHTYTHADLTAIPSDNLRGELQSSRITLEKALDIEVLSLAYPFGQYDLSIADKAADYGYLTAMGLGNLFVQDANDLYYLARYPMDESISHEEFLTIIGYNGSFDDVLSLLQIGNQES